MCSGLDGFCGADRARRDADFMNAALYMAKAAALEGEVPVGCVVVRDGQIIAAAHNRRERRQDALAHAELLAVRLACETVGYWRLPDCSLYVTLEPCPMCAGAIINARVGELVYAASDPKAGACGSICDLFALPFNHHPVLRAGVLAEASASLLRDFFRELRAVGSRKTRASGWKRES